MVSSAFLRIKKMFFPIKLGSVRKSTNWLLMIFSYKITYIYNNKFTYNTKSVHSLDFLWSPLLVALPTEMKVTALCKQRKIAIKGCLKTWTKFIRLEISVLPRVSDDKNPIGFTPNNTSILGTHEITSPLCIQSSPNV